MQRTNQNKPNWNVLLWPQALNANPFQLVIASQTSGRVLGPQEFHIKKDASKITTYGARCKHQPAFCRVPSQLVDSQQLGATFSSSLPWLCQSAGPKETAGSKFEVNIIMVATAPGAKKTSNVYVSHLGIDTIDMWCQTIGHSNWMLEHQLEGPLVPMLRKTHDLKLSRCMFTHVIADLAAWGQLNKRQLEWSGHQRGMRSVRPKGSDSAECLLRVCPGGSRL